LGRLAETARRLNMKRLIDFQMEFIRAFESVIGRPSEQEAVMRETAIRCLG
jgi:DNA polymerase III subunit delta